MNKRCKIYFPQTDRIIDLISCEIDEITDDHQFNKKSFLDGVKIKMNKENIDWFYDYLMSSKPIDFYILQEPDGIDIKLFGIIMKSHIMYDDVIEFSISSVPYEVSRNFEELLKFYRDRKINEILENEESN